MSDTPDQIEAVSERGTFRVSKSCETHSGWRLVNVSTAPDGMDSAEVWKCPRCLQEELERRDERIRELEQKVEALSVDRPPLPPRFVLAAKLRSVEQANKELLEALRGMRTMMDHGPEPKKLDEALSWRENDMWARQKCDAALSKHGGTK